MRMAGMFKSCMRMIPGAVSAIISAAFITGGALSAFCLIHERLTGKFGFILDWRPVYVTSGSMEPSIPAGSIVIAEKAEMSDISEGDIILFDNGAGMVVHRFLGTDGKALNDGKERFLITGGDANNTPDIRRTAPEEIIGRVCAIVPAWRKGEI